MIVYSTVIVTSIKEVIARMGLNKETESSVYPTAENRAVNGTVIPRYPQIPISIVESPDLVVPHAIVHGENNLDAVTPNF
jgi:hypothetical protein